MMRALMSPLRRFLNKPTAAQPRYWTNINMQLNQVVQLEEDPAQEAPHTGELPQVALLCEVPPELDSSKDV